MKGEGEIEVEIMAQRRKNKWDMKYMPPHTKKKPKMGFILAIIAI